MRIVIDMQGVQTESRFLGVGSYTLSFAQAVVRNREEHEIILALSGLFPETIEPLRAAFDGLLPQENIRVWHAPEPIRKGEPLYDNRQQVTELLREAFWVSLQPDLIHITNIYEKSIDNLILTSDFIDHHIAVSFILPPSNEQKSFCKREAPDLLTKPVIFVLPATEVNRFSIENQQYTNIEIDFKNENSSAIEVIKYWQKITALNVVQSNFDIVKRKKPRLAFVSPLPPERTGIADYSAELLPYLSTYYEIELVVEQDHIDHPWCNSHGQVHDVKWLRANSTKVDRVMYHIGNSKFHAHMLSLTVEVPGIVVLHDFYIGHLLASLENVGTKRIWSESLFLSHGYMALKTGQQDPERAMYLYPVNNQIVQNSLGIVVHSENSRTLAVNWNGPDLANSFRVIPLLRAPSNSEGKTKARRDLGISESVLLICSFGFLGVTKLNHRLIKVWLETELPENKNAHLIFVGENDTGIYGDQLLKIINGSRYRNQIHITGFVSAELMKSYLAAADLAVQLRTLSRGETSAAILDCMNYGLPVIVNANGSMAELDRDAVHMLPDDFDDAALKDSLNRLAYSKSLRKKMGERAQKIIFEKHSPDVCARQYSEAIEDFFSKQTNKLPNLIHSIARLPDFSPSEIELQQLAVILEKNHVVLKAKKCLYLDVTFICRNDLKTGIQRVVRALTLSLLESPPFGYRVEPVRLIQEDGSWIYRYARNFTLGLIGCPLGLLKDEKVNPEAGDVLIALDLTGDTLIQAEKFGLYESYRNQGVSVFAIVYDLLPVRMPSVFPDGANQSHYDWLKAISNFDGAIAISKAVADDLNDWQTEVGLTWLNRRPYTISWFHLGADISKSAPSQGVPQNAKEILPKLIIRPTFLIVGTIEPRKAYIQTLDAFELLWNKGIDINLVIVGREGWRGLIPEKLCRDIPQTINRLRTHTERNNRLFWLDDVSDEYLEHIYSASTCLVAASYGEGFGLPLIEAAQYTIPILARDIPVFREVAGDYAHYFKAVQSTEMAQALENWLTLYKSDLHPKSVNMPWLNWKDSASNLLKALNLKPDITIKN